MLEHAGIDAGVRLARKHIGWYSRGLPGSAEFRAAVNQRGEAAQVERLIDDFYDPLIGRDARPRSNGPKRLDPIPVGEE